MFKFDFQGNVQPTWATPGAQAAFDFIPRSKGSDAARQVFDFSFSNDHRAEPLDRTEFEQWCKDSRGKLDELQVEIRTPTGENHGFWLRADEFHGLGDGPLAIAMEFGNFGIAGRLSPPRDPRAKILGDKAVFPLLVGLEEEDLTTVLSDNFQVDLLRTGVPNRPTSMNPEQEDLPQIQIFPNRDVEIGFLTSSASEWHPIDSPLIENEIIMLALGFDARSVDERDSSLSVLLDATPGAEKYFASPLSSRRLRVVTGEGTVRRWGRPYEQGMAMEVDVAEAVEKLGIVQVAWKKGFRRYLQTEGKTAKPIKVVDIFETNAQAATQESARVDLIDPVANRSASQNVDHGTIDRDIVEVNTTIQVNTQKFPVRVSAHVYVTRAIILAVDFGSQSWLGSLFLRDGTDVKEEVVSIGPASPNTAIDNSEGLSEIYLSGGEGSVPADTDFKELPFVAQRREKQFGVRPSALNILRGHDVEADAIGTPEDRLRGGYLPYFKSALYRGDKDLDLPQRNSRRRSIPMDEAFRAVFEQVLAEILENQNAKDSITAITSKAATQEEKDEMVLGVLVTHPGFITAKTHDLLVNTIKDVLFQFHDKSPSKPRPPAQVHNFLDNEFGLSGDPSGHLSLVRALPEPLAAAMVDLTNPAYEPYRVACIDVGRRTLDIAVFSAKTHAGRNLTECWGTDLGGQRLDYAILSGIVELLRGTVDKTLVDMDAVSNNMPLSDKKLGQAFTAQNSDETRRRYKRFQTILKEVERAKCNLADTDTTLRLRLSDIPNVVSDAEWFDPATTASLVRAATHPTCQVTQEDHETVLSVARDALFNTKAIRLYQYAVRRFCEVYLFSGDTDAEELHITVCGRAAQSAFLGDVFSDLEAKATSLIKVQGTDAKRRVVQGAVELIKNPELLLTDEVKLRLSLLFLRNNKSIIEAHDLTYLKNFDVYVPEAAAWAVVVPVERSLAMVPADGDVDQNAWYEAMFIDTLLDTKVRVQEYEEVSLRRDNDARPGKTSSSGIFHWTLMGRRRQTWTFLSHGGLNQ